jgi:ABC-type dipeptide/oligopeptide/nickel transport system permease subunit
MGLFGTVVVGILVFAALAAPIISPYDPIAQHPGLELRPPSAQFLLGTDHLGRDLLSRIIFGSRSSLLIGMLAVGLGAGFGIASGLAAGYLGGWVDAVLMRFYDALLSFPAILLGIGVVSVLGSGPISVMAESALTFLGLGTQPPLPSWGGMLNESRAYLRTAPWFGSFSGLALALLLLGLNCLSDALRDALDPRRSNA